LGKESDTRVAIAKTQNTNQGANQSAISTRFVALGTIAVFPISKDGDAVLSHAQ
jgi:hypothetical protein